MQALGSSGAVNSARIDRRNIAQAITGNAVARPRELAQASRNPAWRLDGGRFTCKTGIGGRRSAATAKASSGVTDLNNGMGLLRQTCQWQRDLCMSALALLGRDIHGQRMSAWCNVRRLEKPALDGSSSIGELKSVARVQAFRAWSATRSVGCFLHSAASFKSLPALGATRTNIYKHCPSKKFSRRFAG